MITPSSNKGSFGTYFRYRLRSQLKYLIVCSMLNILMLPLYSINVLIMVKSLVSMSPVMSQFNTLTNGFHTLSALAFFFLTFFSGAAVFDYCVRSERTDTFGGLPITLRDKFFADFLSGYITRVAPLIPCSVFSMIMSVSIESLYSKLPAETWSFDGIIIKAFAELNLALFFSYTFAYILSVLITICCGRVSSSRVYTILSSIVLIIGSCAAIGFAMSSRMTTGSFDDVVTALRFVPPLGIFAGKAYSIFNDIGFVNFEYTTFDLTSPVPIIIYIVIAAALIAIAYLAFKYRKPENTGHPIAVKRFYHVFAGACAFSLICICCYPMYQLWMWWLSALVSVVVSAIALTIFTVANKEDRPRVKKNLIRNASIIAGSIAFLFIFDKTGAFGTRYYNYSAEKTKSIEVIMYDYFNNYRESFTIDDKADIEQFITATNKTMKARTDELESGYAFIVTYNLENGNIINRSYDVRNTSRFDSEPNAIEEMFENICDLPNYAKYSSEKAYGMINSGYTTVAVMYDKFGEIYIPDDRIEELKNILAREILEKYDKNAKKAGIVSVTSDDEFKDGSNEIQILECYTDTIAFVEAFREYDGDKEAFSIEFHQDPYMKLTVRIKNVSGEAEKELFSLFEPMTYKQYYFSRSSGFSITSSNRVRYYVPDENKERVTDLMMTIIENTFTQQSQ